MGSVQTVHGESFRMSILTRETHSTSLLAQNKLGLPRIPGSAKKCAGSVDPAYNTFARYLESLQAVCPHAAFSLRIFFTAPFGENKKPSARRVSDLVES